MHVDYVVQNTKKKKKNTKLQKNNDLLFIMCVQKMTTYIHRICISSLMTNNIKRATALEKKYGLFKFLINGKSIQSIHIGN